ncbi:MAG TPA: hypothetical protein VGO47_11775 [Chlamydiales bacterium]|jgi:hypothetical protein|nr:hypothetical protein [Chlamydiales bacterium]
MSSNTGNVLSGLTSYTTRAGLSMAMSAGSVALHAVAATGRAVANEIFNDDFAPTGSSSRERESVSARRDEDKYNSLTERAKGYLDERLQEFRTEMGLPAQRAPEAPPSSVHSNNEDADDDFEMAVKMVGALAVVILAVKFMNNARTAIPAATKLATKTSWLPSQGKVLFTAGAVAVAWFAVKPQLVKFLEWADL